MRIDQQINHLTRVTKTRDESDVDHRIDLSAAINETVSFQFIITTTDTPLLQPSFKITPTTNSEPRTDPAIIEIFRIQRVKLGTFPGWHERAIPPYERNHEPLDVLVPLNAPRGGMPDSLQPNTTYFFWVDLNIPKGTFEGDYSTVLRLQSGGKELDTVRVNYKVWPFILPDQNTIPFLAELDHRALFYQHIREQGRPFVPARDDWQKLPAKEKMDDLLISTVQLLQDHRLAPILPRLSPLVSVNTMGEVLVDWRAYDAIVTPIMNGRMFANRIPSPCWPLPLQTIFSTQRTISNQNSDPSTRGSDRFRTQYLNACTNHFDQQGWLEQAYSMLPDDHNLDPKSVEDFRRLAQTMQKLTHKCRILSSRIPQDMEPFGWIDYSYFNLLPNVDIWSPPAQYYDTKLMADLRMKYTRTWVTLDRPPFSGTTSVFAPSTFTRVLSWQATQIGAQAIRLGTINRWPENKIDVTPDQCIQTDPGVLIYPGTIFGLNKPVASVRLKHLRDSQQDSAYRTLLNSHELSHITQAISKAIAPYAGTDAYRTHFADGRQPGWLNLPELYALARDVMTDQLMKNANDHIAAGRVESFAQSAQWRRFMLSAKKFDVTVDGCRVRLASWQPGMTAEIECSLTMTNHTRTPVSGVLRFTDLPNDIVAETTTRNVSAIPPYASRHISLSASLHALPVEPGGTFLWPILFTSDDGNDFHFDARVSMIMAVDYTGPIIIDGHLQDWPPGDTNILSDFRLISGGKSDTPSSRTLGLVMRDQDYLYVAINCILTPGDTITYTNKNTVEFDDMIPVGEDLIELLIDPLNSGTRSPSDLYHIAIKPGGAYRTEQGIDFNARCSRRKPWPADMVIATHMHDHGWTTEMRIPFHSLSVNHSQSSIWGFSITRRDAANQEFSTSSASVGNAYDPISLGNLFIP